MNINNKENRQSEINSDRSKTRKENLSFAKYSTIINGNSHNNFQKHISKIIKINKKINNKDEIFNQTFKSTIKNYSSKKKNIKILNKSRSKRLFNKNKNEEPKFKNLKFTNVTSKNLRRHYFPKNDNSCNNNDIFSESSVNFGKREYNCINLYDAKIIAKKINSMNSRYFDNISSIDDSNNKSKLKNNIHRSHKNHNNIKQNNIHNNYKKYIKQYNTLSPRIMSNSQSVEKLNNMNNKKMFKKVYSKNNINLQKKITKKIINDKNLTNRNTIIQNKKNNYTLSYLNRNVHLSSNLSTKDNKFLRRTNTSKSKKNNKRNQTSKSKTKEKIYELNLKNYKYSEKLIAKKGKTFKMKKTKENRVLASSNKDKNICYQKNYLNKNFDSFIERKAISLVGYDLNSIKNCTINNKYSNYDKCNDEKLKKTNLTYRGPYQVEKKINNK